MFFSGSDLGSMKALFRKGCFFNEKRWFLRSCEFVTPSFSLARTAAVPVKHGSSGEEKQGFGEIIPKTPGLLKTTGC